VGLLSDSWFPPSAVRAASDFTCTLTLSLPSPSLVHAQDSFPNIRLSQRVNSLENEPDVAVHVDRAVAVWFRSTLCSRVGWGFSLDGGLTWTEGMGGPSDTPECTLGHPTICVDDAGNFYLAVQDFLSGYSVSVWRGSFQGTTFVWQSPVFALPSEDQLYDSPRITCDPNQGILYLSCTRATRFYPHDFNHEIVIVRSLDGGQTWSAPLILSSPVSNGSRAVVGPDGELYVIWEDFGTEQIVGRRSDDFGQSFGPLFQVGTIRDNRRCAILS
jgi:hypothetical protein